MQSVEPRYFRTEELGMQRAEVKLARLPGQEAHLGHLLVIASAGV